MIKNKKTGQIYIGQSKNIERRFRNHCNITAIDLAIANEGVDNFDFSIIEEVDESLLKEREQYWINYYNAHQNPKHYNRKLKPEESLKNGYGHNNGRAKYTLWDITCCRYQKDKMVKNNNPLDYPRKCFIFKHKGKIIPIGTYFYDFISCEIINQLIEEAIKEG